MAGVQSISVPNFDSSRIPSLNGDNYADWKEKILLTLGCMDLDLAPRVDEPLSSIGKSICGSISECAKVKEYLKAIEQQFEASDKALASTLMTKTCSMKFNGTKRVCEHIMEMRDIAAQTKVIRD
ncbi:hypothetical protein CK203_110279 [Vitis vinifera]|uniref:Gag-pol polyprotein n=1 Tax=Vitis vinifera TaxID=29760 RepID=A0A438CAF2_VITVI|nr:hypothetical protein CK203_110279 [Vitis vinifera]